MRDFMCLQLKNVICFLFPETPARGASHQKVCGGKCQGLFELASLDK
jgi:hypothetical protein